jgi:hypothetical protein
MPATNSRQAPPDHGLAPSTSSRTVLRESTLRAFVWTGIVLLAVSHVLRGLDVTDTGFLVTNQRLIFSAPQSVSYWFHLWLTNIIGGIVDLLFGRYGILPHKIAAALIILASLFAATRLLYRGRVGGTLLLLGIGAGAGFQMASKIFTVHYNNLSALFFVLAAGFLANGVLDGKRMPFFFSGLILGFNCFVRLPNLVGLALILIPFLVPLFLPKRGELSGVGIAQILLYFSGAACATACALGGMAVLRHFPLYLESLRALFSSTAIEAGSYSLSKVIMRVPKTIAYCFLLGTVAISAFLSLFKRRSVQLALTGLGLVLSIAVFVGPLLTALRYKSALYAIVGLCFWLILVGLFDKQSDRDIRLTGALSAGIALALIGGSDQGIHVASFAIPFMLPAALDAASRFSRLIQFTTVSSLQRLAQRIESILPIVIAAVLAAFSLYGSIWMVYRDTPFPTEMVDHRELRGVYTSDTRATALTEGLAEINTLVPEGGTLLAFDSLPLIHFATRTLPYLSNSWPALYGEDYLDKLLRQREREGTLPAVVLAHSNPRSSAWPSNTSAPVHLKPVESFLARNRYREHWSNAAFTILLPEGFSP